jgi:hypothetical protein
MSTKFCSKFTSGLSGSKRSRNTTSFSPVCVTNSRTGNAFDLATGPLVGSPQRNYTFSNAFSGSTGLDTNSYFYTANNGDVSGAVLPKMLAWPHLLI